MTKEIIEDLLDNVLDVPKRMQWKNEKIQFCCPIHHESNPSCGINLNYVPEDGGSPVAVFHCFSCGASGSIPWLVYKSLPDQFKSLQEVIHFLNVRYGEKLEYSFSRKAHDSIQHYEDFMTKEKSARFEMPRSKLAPFKSGKETYQYFYNRGFDEEDMRKFMIGRDLENETVTIPVFWEDNVLAGIIGRYVDPNRPKNMRYKIYEFPKGSLIYPLNHLEVVNDTIIGCESMLDVIMLHKWGYPNAVAMMGDAMSTAQAQQVIKRCRIFIDLFDNDQGGRVAREISRKKLSNHVFYLTPTYYPDNGKDPCEWGELETNKVINSASFLDRNVIPKL